jgi:ribosomal protein L29
MDSEQIKLLSEKKKALRDMHFGATGGKSADVKAARNLRKEIARVMTGLAGK